MTIIKSCCFWKSLRKGSFASAFYTFIYFSTSCVSISLYLYEEREFLTGKIDKPASKSFLGTSSSNVLFSMLCLGCAILGSLSSILVFIGLKKNQREFLVPWIVVMSSDIFIAVFHFIFVMTFGNLKFDPLTGTLFTVDFFILSLNMYCLACVISQYQEYKADRRLASNHYNAGNDISTLNREQKSCIVLQGSTPSALNNQQTNIVVIKELQKMGNQNVGFKSPFQRRKPNDRNLFRKQVQFTDDMKREGTFETIKNCEHSDMGNQDFSIL
ncbi:CLUMA_CG006325, isoform A [Clunio marinus]|uniref:CLUMA_CG006325, isoform A n=1 Tax=Clunio marinus TaxID=568069 RepID=A0A1J1HYZ5_9DIPT|nr:CLUMA_CG006325, isoform A [Clunio marinus]